MSDDPTDAFDPLVHYDELVLAGNAPEPREYAARYPGHPNLLKRIERLEQLRGDLDVAANHMTGDHSWPDTIGEFNLIETLGKGGMGAVFRAEHRASKQACAVKLLRHGSKVARQRFDREARLAATLNHPIIARVIGWGSDAGRAYLATELVVGVTLRDMVDAQVYHETCELQLPRTVRQRVELIVPVAEALGFAHANNVVHRDVKPSNIMVKPDYVPKLIDFGIAVATHSHTQRITRTGVFVGSHNYAAPEQLVGDKDEVGPWTDTYALGVTLYELLALRTPFMAPTFVARASRAKEKPPHRARYYNKGIPRALDALVMRALSPKPRKRFGDGAAMAAALRAWLRKSK